MKYCIVVWPGPSQERKSCEIQTTLGMKTLHELQTPEGNSVICLKCDEKVEQQTNSLKKIDSYSFVI